MKISIDFNNQNISRGNQAINYNSVQFNKTISLIKSLKDNLKFKGLYPEYSTVEDKIKMGLIPDLENADKLQLLQCSKTPLFRNL